MALVAIFALFCASVFGAQAEGESFQACLFGKVSAAKQVCGNVVCTPTCKAAFTKALDSMDGACCTEAPANVKAVCPALVTKVLVPELAHKMEEACPTDLAVLFNDLALPELFGGEAHAANSGPHTSTLAQTILVAFVGGIAGASVMFAFLGRHRVLTAPSGMLG
mmetsp:Transcript_69636/g.215292  ORF Transcript_69636/g.215292 Transcript_69636/m.215292 type:complete len:165 (+) Transcript_69636:66-560(+)|eukprot:CAMPEP_0204522814 /NCGR_PEP_ID=MMETSP0661-20131031/6518_1 /ASSEMBLY_ACC=CAM_ASM_000606 /TAXON_ID=109239 /ORGANISM="Alexandrium margalefi, Strain AMGDE01CS-322" /LENGTH=164 /DNA_ID=CAMNT_0051528495 /DNA_START=66 /DNA_END=560 /DNA_ORIENTATION=-